MLQGRDTKTTTFPVLDPNIIDPYEHKSFRKLQSYCTAHYQGQMPDTAS